MRLKSAGALRVAGVFVGLNLNTAVIAPLVGIADVVHNGIEFLVGFFLGCI